MKFPEGKEEKREEKPKNRKKDLVASRRHYIPLVRLLTRREGLNQEVCF